MSQALIEKFPVEDQIFSTRARKWTARIMNDPVPGSPSSPYPDMVLFDIEFKEANSSVPEVRRLRLWISHARLCSDPGYPGQLVNRVSQWLSMSQVTSGEIWL
jgi:hypothetical protein